MEYYFKEIEGHDLADVLELFNSEMGNTYYSMADLIEHQRSGDLLIGAYSEEDLIAANLSYFLSPGEMINKGIGELLPEHLTASKILYRKTTVVNKEHRGAGLGKELANFIKEISQDSVDAIVSTAWAKSGEVKFPKALQMQYLGEIPNYWYEDSKTKDYFCPACGEPPCTCAAKVYINVL